MAPFINYPFINYRRVDARRYFILKIAIGAQRKIRLKPSSPRAVAPRPPRGIFSRGFFFSEARYFALMMKIRDTLRIFFFTIFVIQTQLKSVLALPVESSSPLLPIPSGDTFAFLDNPRPKFLRRLKEKEEWDQLTWFQKFQRLFWNLAAGQTEDNETSVSDDANYIPIPPYKPRLIPQQEDWDERDAEMQLWVDAERKRELRDQEVPQETLRAYFDRVGVDYGFFRTPSSFSDFNFKRFYMPNAGISAAHARRMNQAARFGYTEGSMPTPFGSEFYQNPDHAGGPREENLKYHDDGKRGRPWKWPETSEDIDREIMRQYWGEDYDETRQQRVKEFQMLWEPIKRDPLPKIKTLKISDTDSVSSEHETAAHLPKIRIFRNSESDYLSSERDRARSDSSLESPISYDGVEAASDISECGDSDSEELIEQQDLFNDIIGNDSGSASAGEPFDPKAHRVASALSLIPEEDNENSEFGDSHSTISSRKSDLHSILLTSSARKSRTPKRVRFLDITPNVQQRLRSSASSLQSLYDY